MAELNNTIVRGNLRVVSQMEAQEILENGTSLANKYLPLAGGNMTGNISYAGSKATNTMIRFIDNTADAYGNGIAIGGGGIVIIGAGESNGLSYGSAGDENLHLAADTNVYLYSNVQSGLDSAKIASLNTSGVFNAPTLSENGTSLVDKYLEITDIASWAKAANKPSYSFSGTAVTSGGNSGTAVAAVTGYSSFSGGSGSLTGNTTASGGIPYVEASLSGTELTLTVKYLHHGHTAASLGSPSTSNCAPSGHTHSVTAAGNIS